MLLAQNGIIPPKQWMHDLNIKSKTKINNSIKSSLLKY